MKEYNKTDVYIIEGKNLGWRNLSGSKKLKAENGEELLKGVLPNTNEFSLWVYKKRGYFKIKCSHHDSPTGEFYYIKPLTKQELKRVDPYEIY